MADVITNRDHDFRYLIRKYGEEGAREVFEKLCAALCHAKYGPEAHRIRCTIGDGGIDVMVGSFNGSVHILQCKYFPGALDASRRRKIKESFETARTNGHGMKEWTLFLPMDLSEREMNWWSMWKEEAKEEHGITLTLCEGTSLLAELKQYGLYDEYFDVTLQRTLDEILEKLTPLARIEEAVAAFSRESVSRVATILDAEAVRAEEAACTGADVEKFYMVEPNFETMCRVVCAGRDEVHGELDKRLGELCDSGEPVILTGHSGTGKSTIMLRTAVSWVRSGGVALWVSFGGNRRLTEAEATQFCREAAKLVPAGKRALLCLDNPAEDQDTFAVLASRWTGGENFQLLLSERANRLFHLAAANSDRLSGWFDGARVLAMMEPDKKRPFTLKDYSVEYIPENYRRKLAILNRSVAVMAKLGEVRGSWEAIARQTLKDYGKPRVSLVELIYRTRFELHKKASKPDKIRMDWDEWKTILRKELELKKSAGQLYGVVALCAFFEAPVTTELFARIYDLRKYDLEETIAKWRMGKNVEPVIYREGSGTLVPKHDVVAELFFLFHRDTLDYNALMKMILDCMNEYEIQAFLKSVVRKKAIQSGGRFPLTEIDYSGYFEQIYDRVLRGTLGLDGTGRARLCQGLLYTVPKQERSDRARRVLRMVAELAPPMDETVLLASLYTEWGILAARLGQEALAEEKYRTVAENHPTQLHARTELGRLYMKQKKYAEAEQVLKEANALDRRQLHSRTELGRVYLQQKKYAEAEQVLREIIALDPGNLQSRTELGRVYLQQKKYAEAEQVLKEAKELDRTHLQSRTELGRVYLQQKKYGEAEQVLREIIALDPGNLQSRTELGRVYLQQKKYGEAEQVLIEANELDRRHLQSRTELGRVYLQQKKYGEAEQVLREIIAMAPHDLQSHVELGRVCLKLGRYQEAEGLLRRALEIDPYNLHPRTVLAEVYTRQGRYAEAKELHDEVLRINPGDEYALRGLRSLEGHI